MINLVRQQSLWSWRREKGLFRLAPRSGIERLKTAAFEFAWAVILIAGSIVAALFAFDLMEMLRW